MTDKIFNSSDYQTIDLGNVQFDKPQKMENGNVFCKAYYLEDDRKKTLNFETSSFVLEKGIQKTPKGEVYVEILYSDTNSPFFDFVDILDEVNIGRTCSNKKKWFRTSISDEELADFYVVPINRRKKNNIFMKIKLDLNNLEILNQFGNKDRLESIAENTKVKARVRFEGLLMFLATEEKRIVPIYRVYEIKHIFERNDKKKTEDAFIKSLAETTNTELELNSDESASESDHSESEESVSVTSEEVEEVNLESDEQANENQDDTELENKNYEPVGELLEKLENVEESKSHIPGELELEEKKESTDVKNLTNLDLEEQTLSPEASLEELRQAYLRERTLRKNLRQPI